MSYSLKGWQVLFGAMAIAACDTTAMGPSPDSELQVLQASSREAGSDVAVSGRPGGDAQTGRTRTVTDRRGDHNRVQKAAREAIDQAKDMYLRAEGLVGPDTRPAIKEALAEAREMIGQAIDAYDNGDYGRALVKAQNAISILSEILRVLS